LMLTLAGEKVKSWIVTSADPGPSGIELPGPVRFDPLSLLQLNEPAKAAIPINRANVIGPSRRPRRVSPNRNGTLRTHLH
jgi:hypothetical protein